jgi:hypothetical protein
LDNRYGGNPATASQKPDLSIHAMEERLKERGTDRTLTQGSLYRLFPFRDNGLIAPSTLAAEGGTKIFPSSSLVSSVPDQLLPVFSCTGTLYFLIKRGGDGAPGPKATCT